MRATKQCILLGFLFATLLTEAYSGWASELHDVAKTGSVDAIQRLLSEGYGPDEADETGNLPLHYAAANGHIDIIKLLSAHGVMLDSTDIQGRTALLIATIAGKTDVMKALLSAGANVNAKAKAGGTALHIATVLRNSDLAEVLIQHGADLNIIDKHKASRGLDGTPLHWAIQLGDKRIVDQLIRAGADLKIKNSRGLTPSRAAYTHYLQTRNSIYFEISRLLKIRSDQREEQQHAPPNNPEIMEPRERGKALP